MTKRRDTLQRISRIDNIYTARDSMEAQIPCGHFVGIMTIEAVLDLYMTEISSPIIINFCLLPEQYRESRTDGERAGVPVDGNKAGMALSGADMDTAAAAGDDESAGRFSDAAAVLPQPELYDRLDANRGSGFWFYSYDKHGVHSILGAQRAGGYGDYI